MTWVAVGSLFACGGDDPIDPDTAPQGEVRYELWEWSHELDAESLAALTPLGTLPEDGVLRFAGRPAQIAALKPKDVLLARATDKTPRGLMVIVLDVRESGEGIEVETQPVALQLAFKSVHAKVPLRAADLGALSAAAPQSLGPRARYTAGKSAGGTTTIDYRAFDRDNDPTTKDNQLYVRGQATGEAGYEVFLDTDWAEDIGRVAEELACAGTLGLACTPDLPDLKIGASAYFKAAIEVDVEGAASAAFDTGEIPIEGTNLDLPAFYIGPVPVFPSIDFVASVHGSANSLFRAKSSISYEVNTSIAVGLTSGVDFQKPTATHAFEPPVFETALGAEVQGSVGPRLRLLIADLFGPTFSVSAYGRGRANRDISPCWSFDLGAEARVGFRVEVPYRLVSDSLAELADTLGLPKVLYSQTFPPFDLFSTEGIASGACGDLPEGVFPPGEGPSADVYREPSFAPWSKRLLLGEDYTYPHSSDSGTHALHMGRAHDGDWIVSGKGLHGVLKLQEDGRAQWGKRIELREADSSDRFEPIAGAVALQSKDTNLWLASADFTVMKLDAEGDRVWARRYLPQDDALAATLPANLAPSGVHELADGSVVVLYTTLETSSDGPAVLLRLTPAGRLLGAKIFAYETAKSVVSAVLSDGEDMIVAGNSWDSGLFVGHIARFDAGLTPRFSKKLRFSCTDSDANYVHPTRMVKLASGAIGLLGEYESSPVRAFFAEVKADGSEAALTTLWTGSNVHDYLTNDVAQLPVTGYLMSAVRVGVGSDVGSLWTSIDATGVPRWQREAQMTDPTLGLWQVRPGGLKLTDDGGALSVTHLVNGDLTAQGLWISKLPARSAEASFDAAKISVSEALPVVEPCSLALVDDDVEYRELTMQEQGITSLVRVTPMTFDDESLLSP